MLFRSLRREVVNICSMYREKLVGARLSCEDIEPVPELHAEKEVGIDGFPTLTGSNIKFTFCIG